MRALVAILVLAVVVGLSLGVFRQAGIPEPLGGPDDSLVASSAPELEIADEVPARSAASEPPTKPEPPLHGIVGRVVDVRDGRVSPAAGVRVELDQLDGETEMTVSTDEDGRFELQLEGPAVRRVFRVHAAGDEEFRRARRVVGLQPEQLFRDDLELRRTAYAPLSGTVFDPFGERLPGVGLSFARRDGRPALRVVSDDRGEFVVAETAHLTGDYDATLPGYRFLWAHPLLPAERGGWRPIEILLSPLASLVVRVLDDAGDPVEGARVSLGIADAERVSVARSARWADGGSRSRPPTPVERVSGPDGSATFEDGWSCCRLVVGHAGTRYEAVRSDTLVTPHDAAGPLVLAPGAPRFVVLRQVEPRAEQELRVEVAVRDLRGAVPERADVLVRAIDRAGEQVGEALLERSEPGLYVGRLRGSLADSRIVAFAATRLRPSKLKDPAGATRVHVRDAEEGVLRIEVAMGSTLALTGRIVDAAGTAARGYLGATRETGSPPGPLDEVAARFRDARLGENGEFRIPCLEPGTYRLELDERRDGAFASHVFGGLRAGATDLVLVIDPPADVNVHVRARAENAPVARCIAVLGGLGGGSPGGVPGPTGHELKDPGEWPARVTLGASGSVGRTFMRVGDESNAHRWEGLRAGRYVVGIEGWNEEGRPFFPLASEPVNLGSGDHHFVAHLRASAAFHGRILGGLDEDLAIALEDAAGRLVSVFPNGADPADVVPVTGAGRFSVAVAPSGRFSLVVGSREELREGRARKRVPLSLTAWSDEVLEIDLR